MDLKTHPNATAAAPGFTFSVSAPEGGGFSNVLFAERSLESAMRKEHNLVIVAYGTNGMASVRSLLDWQPAMAHASQHGVTVFISANPKRTPRSYPSTTSGARKGLKSSRVTAISTIRYF